MNQSLDEGFELATIQKFSIEVVRVEVVSVNAFAAVLAALENHCIACSSSFRWYALAAGNESTSGNPILSYHL